MVKLQAREEDESGQAGGLLVGAAPLLIGGIALFLIPNSSTAQWVGAMLALVGLALASAAIWLRVGLR